MTFYLLPCAPISRKRVCCIRKELATNMGLQGKNLGLLYNKRNSSHRESEKEVHSVSKEFVPKRGLLPLGANSFIIE